MVKSAVALYQKINVISSVIIVESFIRNCITKYTKCQHLHLAALLIVYPSFQILGLFLSKVGTLPYLHGEVFI